MNREYMMQADVDASNAFVKKNQNEQKKMFGKEPILPAEYKKFDACMTNEGDHAKELARNLTKGLDKDAFPVK